MNMVNYKDIYGVCVCEGERDRERYEREIEF